jgi:hypothetical protein
LRCSIATTCAVLVPVRGVRFQMLFQSGKRVPGIFLNIRIGPARHFSIILIHLLLTFLQSVFYISLVELHAG